MTPRRARLLVAAVAVAAAALLVAAGMQGTLTFYRTPAEVLHDPAPAGQRVRLGGTVVPGSLRSEGGRTRFLLRDGAAEITVEQSASLPGTVREGQDAVVEGVLDAHGVFRSDTVMAKHGNEYRPAGPGEAADGGAAR
ncbi:cytochrome c maturation protein CcmE [Rhizomonospora bruguierae]|uniref:cytochrome c maturation protein CcmE n=1 Tax=Rhizomonospora bruguierae TaxID=1581705 RepID=UPI001BCD7BA4|nr:cytochrome c maturation protein CcmE [Micromonospora sp. NBRC 107566]